MAITTSSRKKTANSDGPSDFKYACDLCPRSFSRLSDLKRHVKGPHKKIKEFKCSRCGKAFAQKGGLKTHENIHTGNMPYECRLGCGYGPWADPSTRSRHEFEYHAPPGFHCPEGCASFKRKDTLKSHILSVHSDKANSYTESQLANHMTRERFNAEILEPARKATDAARLLTPDDEAYIDDPNPQAESLGPAARQGRRSTRLAAKPLSSLREPSPMDDSWATGPTATSPLPTTNTLAALPGTPSSIVAGLSNTTNNFFSHFPGIQTPTSAFTPFNRSGAATPQLPLPDQRSTYNAGVDMMNADFAIPLSSYFNDGASIGGLGLYLEVGGFPGGRPSGSEFTGTANLWDPRAQLPMHTPQTSRYVFPPIAASPSTMAGPASASPSVPGLSARGSPDVNSLSDYYSLFHPRGDGLTLDEMRLLGLELPIDPALQ